jgi:putative membrane protein
MKKLSIFIVRWLLNSLGLWIAVRLLGDGYDNIGLSIGLTGFLTAGLIFSIVNSVLKPILTIVSLPAILLTLGLFTLLINGLLVYISLRLTSISMTFLNSIFTGMLLSLINYIISATLAVRLKGAKYKL